MSRSDSLRFSTPSHNSSGVPNLRIRRKPHHSGGQGAHPVLDGAVRVPRRRGKGRLRAFTVGLTLHDLPTAIRIAIDKIEALTGYPYPLTWRQVLRRIDRSALR